MSLWNQWEIPPKTSLAVLDYVSRLSIPHCNDSVEVLDARFAMTQVAIRRW